MDQSKPRFLFFDLDGTVYINKEIPDENIRAMKAAQKMGHKLILHTGRSYASAEGTKVAFSVPWDGMIFGASDLRFAGRVLEQQTVPESECMAWLEYGLRQHATVVFSSVNFLLPFPFAKHPEPFTKAEIGGYRKQLREQYRKDPTNKLTVYGILDRSELPKTDLTVIQLSTYADIFPTGCDKGTAIKRFCELTDTSLEQCVCFGDSENDLAMFRVCPTGVCMKNAPEELVRLSAYHAKTELGVAEGLHELFGV